MRGKVLWFNDDKGYGFVQAGDKEVFVHHSNVVMEGHRTLFENQLVEFDVIATERGAQAVKVTPVAPQEVLS